MIMAANTVAVPARDVFIRSTATIVASYVAKHEVATATLPDVIRDVFETLRDLTGEAEPEAPPPVGDLTSSVFPDYLVCLEDGEQMAMLKRHLWTCHGMTPDEYRAKWDLPPDYPMVAPNYAKVRSDLAKQSGLGRHKADQTIFMKRRDRRPL
jgi:predicted transcriptional regulator